MTTWRLEDEVRQGVFSAEFLREEFIDELKVTEISVDNKELLRLRVGLINADNSLERGGKYEIDFDPSLGYRYLRCAMFGPDGTLAHEILLSDYRDVGGHVMPFQIKESNFRSDGTLRRYEEISVKTADFDEPVTDADFAIEVPEGTSLTCNIEGIQKHFTLEGPDSLTVESMIAKAAERVVDKLAYDSLADLEKEPLSDSTGPVADSNDVSDTPRMVKINEPVLDSNEPVRDESLLIAEHSTPSKRKHLLTTVIIVSALGLGIAAYMVRCRYRRS